MNIPHLLILSISALASLPAAAEAPAPGLWQLAFEQVGEPPARPEGTEVDNKKTPGGKTGKPRGEHHAGEQGSHEQTVCLTANDDPNQVFFMPPRRHRGDAPSPCPLTYINQADNSASWSFACDGPRGVWQAQGQAQFSAQNYSGSLTFSGQEGQSEHGKTIVAKRLGDCPAPIAP